MSATILIVDSDPAQGSRLLTTVERFGHRATVVDGGAEALTRLGVAGSGFNLVILDLATPSGDGVGVLGQFRQMFRHIPVIVQTASGDIDSVVSAVRAGAADFIAKPTSTERLLVSIENTLKLSALESEVSRLKSAGVGKFAIQTAGLTKKYGNHVALDDLSLEVQHGEIFGFLGHNGAGKTTTIHILTTLLSATSGTARICGYDVASESMSARRNIGYVPENVRLYDGMTAQENLLFFARLSGLEDPVGRIHETLAFLESSDLAPRLAGTFSKGLRQRIGLAQAILHRPKVLFLDEPTSGLDPLGIKMLRDVIVKLNAEYGMTVFMNTHLISEVSKTCTSIGVLSHGRLVYRDTIGAVMDRFKDDTALEGLYLSLTPGADDQRAA